MKESQSPRLFTSVLLRVLPVAVGVLLVVWAIVSWASKDALHHQIHQQLDRQTTALATATSVKLNTLKEAAHALAVNQLLINGLIDTIGRDSYLPIFFRSLTLPGPEGATVTLTDYRGRTIVSTHGLVSYDAAPWIAGVLDGHDHFDLSANGLTIAVPVSYDGMPEGMLVVQFPAERTRDLLSVATTTRVVAVANTEGLVLHTTDPTFVAPGGRLAEITKSEWTSATTQLEGYPQLRLVTAIPTQEAYGSVIRLNRILLSAVLLDLLALIAGIMLTGRMVSQPLSRLTRDIMELGRSADLSRQVTPVGPAEIQGLARSFNEMTRGLHEAVVSKDYIQQVIDGAPTVVCRIATDGSIRDINRATEVITGYTREELVGRSWRDAFFPDSQDVLEADGLDTPQELTLTTKTTQKRTVVWRMIRIDGMTLGSEEIVGFAHDITELKQAEADLRLSQEQFDLAVRGSNDGLWDWRDVTRSESLWWSSQFNTLLGYGDDEIESSLSTFRGMLHPEDDERVMDAIKSHLEDHVPYDIRYRLNTKTEGYRWFRARGQAIWNEEGVATRMSGSIRDVHDHEMAEQALRKSQQHLKGVLDNTSAVIYMKDLEGRYLLANRRFKELFNLTDETINGQTDYDIFPKDYADAFSLNDKQILETRKVIQSEEVAPHADGPHTYVSVKFPICDDDGEIHAVAGISTDITDRKGAELALRESEERFELAVRGSSDGLWDWLDVDGDKEWWSPRFYELLGYRDGEIEATLTNFKAMLHDDDVERTIEAVRAQLEDDIPFDVEYRLRCRDGKYRWFRARGILIRDDDGTPRRMAGSIQDIHERKQAEQLIETTNHELQQKNHEMEQFVYTVSHDLKSPILTMLGYMPYLREDVQEGNIDRAMEAADRVENAAKHMRLSIDNLLDLSRIGRVVHEPVAVDVNELITSITKEMDLMLVGAGISVVVHPEIPSVVADPARIREVLVNLLSNALKYGCTNPAPQIVIGGFVSDGQVIMYVRDNGEGIAAEYQDKVFQLFNRLTNDKNGTGVGLALVKRVMEVHGGKVWIESPIKSPELGQSGPGTAFWLSLPQNDLASEAPTLTRISA